MVVRCRPLFGKELVEGRESIVDADYDHNQCNITNPAKPDVKPKSFTFDAVYDENTLQQLFYEESAHPLVESVMEGFNGTIFACKPFSVQHIRPIYTVWFQDGQTGCGKTHTMQGASNPPELRGVIPRSFDHIFEHIAMAEDKGIYYFAPHKHYSRFHQYAGRRILDSVPVSGDL